MFVDPTESYKLSDKSLFELSGEAEWDASEVLLQICAGTGGQIQRRR